MDDTPNQSPSDILTGDDRGPGLTRIGMALRARGAGDDALEASLFGLNETMCNPPLDDADVNRIIDYLVMQGRGPAPRTDSYGTPAPGPEALEETISKFYTAANIPPAARTEWLVHGLLLVGGITVLVGQAKLAGKSTLMLRMTRAILDGKPFLGRPTMKSSVVLLSEERPSTLPDSLSRAQVKGRPDLHLLNYDPASDRDFATTLEAARIIAQISGAKLIVIDTLQQWANMKGDSENNTGHALAAIRPLQRIAASGVSVLVLHHEPKGGGAIGHAGRGASAFGGAVDVILNLRRPEGSGHTNARVLHGTSRLPETPDELTIELVNEDFVLRQSAAIVRDTTRDEIVSKLPVSEDAAITVAQLEAVVRAGGTTLRSVLAALVEEGIVGATGAGVRNQPVKYWKKLRTDSSGTSTPRAELRTNESPLDAFDEREAYTDEDGE